MTTAADARAVAYELEQNLARYPDERGEILLEAAAQWSRAGEADRATALLEEVLALGGDDAAYARHGLAELCFDRGADADAWAHLEVLEQSGASGTGPAGLVAELLEEHGEYEAALRWFDLAIGAEGAARIKAEPTADHWFAMIPLFGRQRCRTRLGLPVDELDRAADVAERNRRDLVDKLQQIGSSANTRGAASRPARIEMLIWQRDEQLVAARRWPAVFTVDVVGHHSAVEQRLRELARERHGTGVTLIAGSADGFAEHLQRTGGDPAEESVRLAYSADARDLGRTLSWPPGRNSACWCGSARKYKKCCGAPAR